MRQDIVNRGGFDPPRQFRKGRRQRSVLVFITSVALAAATVLAATAVSIGRAHAEILVAAHQGDGSLAVFMLIATIIIGGIVGAIYNNRQQRPH